MSSQFCLIMSSEVKRLMFLNTGLVRNSGTDSIRSWTSNYIFFKSEDSLIISSTLIFSKLEMLFLKSDFSLVFPHLMYLVSMPWPGSVKCIDIVV